ncbi:AraC family transcriptional regulator [Paenibacillus sp. 1P07SE]|uniref:AraC family transcriptional regulator n=1 Tax=Paenibacillus sp. 1P07SE TaxID=3132209 RepID=UPI0039A624EC
MWKRIRYRGNEIYFYKLFTTIAFSISIMILILTVFLYVNFKSYSLDLLYRADQRQIQTSFENALQLHAYMKTYSNALYHHPDTLQLMSGDSSSVLDTLNSLRALDTTVNSAPYLYSVYIYNGSEDIFYMTGANAISRSSADFHDEEMTALLKDRRQLLTGQPVPRSVPVSSENDGRVQVFTYVLADYRLDAAMPVQALIVNVRIEWLFSTLASYGQKERLEGQSLLVLDADGRAVAHSDRRQFLSDLSGESYVQALQRSSPAAGYALDEVDGRASVLSYSTSTDARWTMVSITPYAYIADTVNKVRTITLLIGFAMFITCLIVAFLLSRRLYSPVRRLREEVGAWPSRPEAEGREDEFSFISRSMNTTKSQLSSLALFKNSNIHALRQTLLRNVLDRTLPAALEARFQEYRIPLDAHGGVALMLLKIDRYAQFVSAYSDQDQALIKYAMMNIAEEIVNAHQPGVGVDMGGDHVVLILNTEDAESGQTRRLGEEIQAGCRRFCSVSLSLFLSDASGSLREAGMQYRELLDMSRYRIFLGHGCLLTAAEFDEQSYAEHPIEHQALSQLMDAIRKGSFEDMQRMYREMAARLEATSYNELMHSLSMMTALIFQTLGTLERNSSVTFETDFIAFDQKIKSLETLQQIHDEFEAFFGLIAQRINQNKGERSLRLVNSAERYILLHFTDKTLTTHRIAEHVGLSAAYLGKLFREHNKQSISEFLTEARLQQAARLLQDTGDTVDEIIHQVGWENKKYFFTLFKRQYGSTPTEYRLKVRLAQDGE